MNDPYTPHLRDPALYRSVYEDLYSNPTYRMIPARHWMIPFDPRPGSTILELGAGTGGNLVYYAERGYRIDGVELAQRAVGIFQEYISTQPEDLRERITLEQGWIEEYQPRRLYDYVICAEVLEHVIDPVAILQVARRALKDTGILYVTAPAWRAFNEFSHVRAVEPEILRGWMEETGFIVTGMEEQFRDTQKWRVTCWSTPDHAFKEVQHGDQSKGSGPEKDQKGQKDEVMMS